MAVSMPVGPAASRWRRRSPLSLLGVYCRMVSRPGVCYFCVGGRSRCRTNVRVRVKTNKSRVDLIKETCGCCLLGGPEAVDNRTISFGIRDL